MKIEAATYVNIYKCILRHWIHTLPTPEFYVLLFINERTYRFNHSDAVITLSHFLNGCFTREGKLMQQRLPFGKTTIIEAYSSLRQKGLIDVYKSAGRNVFEINCKNLFVEGNSMARQIKLKSSRNGRKARSKLSGSVSEQMGSLTEQVGSETEPASICNRSSRYKNTFAENRQIPNSRTATGGLSSDNSKSRLRRGRLDYAMLVSVWEKAVEMHYPNIPLSGYTQKDHAILKAAIQKSNIGKLLSDNEEFEGIRRYEFINKLFLHIVDRWDEYHTKLSWINNWSTVPDLKLVSHHFKHFLSIYAGYLVQDEKLFKAKGPHRQNLVESGEGMDGVISKLQTQIAHLQEDLLNEHLVTRNLTAQIQTSNQAVKKLQRKSLDEARKRYARGDVANPDNIPLTWDDHDKNRK